MSDPIAIMRSFVEDYQTAGNEAVAEKLLAPDFVDHTPFPGFGGTRQDVLQLFRVLRAAFPDLRAEIHEQFAQGSRVATRKTFYGTHLGAFAGIPPTGRSVEIRVIDLVEIAGGQLREHWNVVDVDTLMRTLSA